MLEISYDSLIMKFKACIPKQDGMCMTRGKGGLQMIGGEVGYERPSQAADTFKRRERRNHQFDITRSQSHAPESASLAGNE